MPLERRLIRIPLSAGMDTKSNIRGLQPLAAPLMQNCVRLKTGAIRKRFGTSALTKLQIYGGNSIASCVDGGSYRGSLWMADTQRLFVWSDEKTAWAGLAASQYEVWPPEALPLDRIEVFGGTAQTLDCDWAQASNGLLYVITSHVDEVSGKASIYVSVLDGAAFGAASGIGGLQQAITAGALTAMYEVYGSPTGSVIGPKLVACGNNIICTFIDEAGNLKAGRFDATASGGNSPFQFATTAILVTAASLTANAKAGGYDAAPVVGDTTRFAVAVATGANGLCFKSFSSSALTLNATLTPTSVADAQSVGLYATNNGYWWAVAGLVTAGVASIYASFYNDNGGAVSTTATALASEANGVPLGKIGIGPVSGQANPSIGTIWSTGYASGSSAMRTAYARYGSLSNNAGTTIAAGTLSKIPGVQLASRPVNGPATINQSAYVALYTPSTLQGTTYLAELCRWSIGSGTSALPPARAVATFAPRLLKTIAQPLASGGSWTLPHLSPLSTIASYASTIANALGVHAFPLLYSTSTFHNSVALQPLDFGLTKGRPTAELGNMMAMATGCPTSFDGQQMVELGFPSYPEPSAADVGGGGSLSAGTYQYIVTYEWYDAAGNVHRSATSPVQTITAANGDSSTIVIPNPGLSRRQLLNSVFLAVAQPPYAIIYRTTAGGSTFYRQTADPPPIANALFADALTITITDTLSDAALTAAATAQLLYTTGGLLDNFNPSSARWCVQHMQRWMLGGGDNPRLVWASKALTDGECPGFNEQLAFFATGAVRAAASLDDKFVMFVQRGASYGIEYITGQGPTDTGTQSDWSPPLPIPSDVGAIDQRGTCVGPFGVLFRSPVGGPNGTGGIFLLSRDLQVSYVGAPVEDFLAACPIVTSMVVHPNAGRVYITTITNDAAPATTNGATRLVWDYLNGGVWSVDNLWDTDAGAAGLACRAGWVANAGGIAGAAQGATYHCASSGGRVYRENTLGTGAGAYLDAGSQWITMTYKSAPIRPDPGGFARFWRVQLEADSLETHDFTMQLLYDFAPASYYQESHTWTGPQAATFDRFPQIDVEMVPGNQKAKAIQVVFTDATPTGGGATTGQGPSWATIIVELGIDGGRFPNIPGAQRS